MSQENHQIIITNIRTFIKSLPKSCTTEQFMLQQTNSEEVQKPKPRITRGLRLIEKFMRSQTAQQTITIHNISKSKGNQEVKFW